jgi:hypothetical protein
MKKRILVAIVTILVAHQTYAQRNIFTLGAKIGINQGQLTQAPKLTSPTTTGSFVAGVFGRVKFLSMYVGPEVLFTQRRGIFKEDSSKLSVTNTLSYIDVPLLIGAKFAAFRAYVGPNFQFLVGARQDATVGLKDPYFGKSSFNSSVVGFQVGAGVDLGKVVIDMRYDGSIGSLGKKVATSLGNQIDYSTKSRMVQLTIGYKFL